MPIFLKIFILTLITFLVVFDLAMAGVDPPPLSEPLVQLDSGNPGNWIGQYVAAIYRYGVGVAAFLAVIMIMIGGLIWLTSAGRSGQVETGKDFVKSALFGLLLAMFSFVMLYAINPRLTVFQPLDIASPDLSGPEGRAIAGDGLTSGYLCSERIVSKEACDNQYKYSQNVDTAVWLDRSCDEINFCGNSAPKTNGCCVVKFKLLDDGDWCNQYDDEAKNDALCASGVCNTYLIPDRCYPKLPTGGNCLRDIECTSGQCNLDSCL